MFWKIKKLKQHEICSIIESCARNHVTELKFGDLHICLGRAEQEVQPQTPTENDISEEIRKISHQALEQRKDEIEDTEVSELMLTDPDEFERRISEGELDATRGESGRPA